MENIITITISVLLGTILGNFLKTFWERKSDVEKQKQEYKEIRYKCLILLMYAALDFEKENVHLTRQGRNFKSIQDLMDEIRMEWVNMVLFASDEALKTVTDFINSPNEDTYKKSLLAIRKDLWGGKSKLDYENIRLKNSSITSP